MQFEKYPFEKLNELLKDIEPNENFYPITLTIGEPQFETPKFIQKELCKNANLLKKYPKSSGEEILKESILEFLKNRYRLDLKNSQIIPTFGTREVLFNFPQFLLSSKKNPVIAFTNPFYQIYEGSAIASKADIKYLNLTKENNFKPVLDEEILKDCDLVIINSPNNPTASVMSKDELKKWVEAALKYDFVLLNDECYSEIYDLTPPASLLEASVEVGNSDFKNILVVNSISKRSSAPGLRSGFIAGDEEILKDYMRYRTYVGCASPLPLQMAAAKAWSDESHVVEFRKKYAKNFKIAKEILNITPPLATFYIWLEVEDDIEFTKKLYKNYNVKVLPGSFLGRVGIGKGYVRIALVYDEKETKEALERIKEALKG
ncbi:succinyldiaminopimelate transaminase [Nitrosophilus kaiyonis]|uniref:succinyldiaminopimelate transaminase n=1 Tax=Nitrosophilus kaiyonis TaxID=2930200 RepID=UPI0024926A3C|nr:succinyldiaminopimelate transaminase [Nitrosophilus kaiyonis]